MDSRSCEFRHALNTTVRSAIYTLQSNAFSLAADPVKLMSRERLDGQQVSADYFNSFPCLAIAGRFQPKDIGSCGPTAVILSDRLWRRRFGGDTSIKAGKQITLDESSRP